MVGTLLYTLLFFIFIDNKFIQVRSDQTPKINLKYGRNFTLYFTILYLHRQ
nr:MAG TPA: hypothetical protein [Bacteriophage sp.]